MAEQPFQFGAQWHGRCFICGALSGPYHTGDRICKQCTERYKRPELHFFRDVSDLSSCFATILPETDRIADEDLRKGFKDLFLGSGRDDVSANPRELLETVLTHELLLPLWSAVAF